MAAYSKMDEKPKKEVKEYVEKPHAGARRFVGFFFLIILIVFAFFLPNISDMVTQYKTNKDNENITSGQLRCSMTNNNIFSHSVLGGVNLLTHERLAGTRR